jgi:hypothetical protein
MNEICLNHKTTNITKEVCRKTTNITKEITDYIFLIQFDFIIIKFYLHMVIF